MPSNEPTAKHIGVPLWYVHSVGWPQIDGIAVRLEGYKGRKELAAT